MIRHCTVRAPAEVSTDDDILKDTLNDVRVSDFSDVTHNKIFILECALANSNRGQGLGFCVLGTVIDLQMLNKLLLKLCGALSATVPLALAYSTFGVGESTGLRECDALSMEHVQTLQLWVSAVSAGSNCSLANLTIGEVLSM